MQQTACLVNPITMVDSYAFLCNCIAVVWGTDSNVLNFVFFLLWCIQSGSHYASQCFVSFFIKNRTRTQGEDLSTVKEQMVLMLFLFCVTLWFYHKVIRVMPWSCLALSSHGLGKRKSWPTCFFHIYFSICNSFSSSKLPAHHSKAVILVLFCKALWFLLGLYFICCFTLLLVLVLVSLLFTVFPKDPLFRLIIISH